jgi:hypothetical protein
MRRIFKFLDGSHCRRTLKGTGAYWARGFLLLPVCGGYEGSAWAAVDEPKALGPSKDYKDTKP